MLSPEFLNIVAGIQFARGANSFRGELAFSVALRNQPRGKIGQQACISGKAKVGVGNA